MTGFDFTQSIDFENDRVRLAPLEVSNIGDLQAIALEEISLLQYSPSEIHLEEKLRQYVETAIESREKKIRYPYIIFDKLQDQYAGSTSFGNVSNKDLRLEIGWTWIGKNFQGSGLNQACKSLMLEYAFDTLSFERVEFKIDSRNLQSRKAVEKIGGIYEGELRSHTVMSDGFRRNTVYYSILKEEWPQIKSKLQV
ncbi:MAG: GNAT family N-acetyltransferase [Cyclobacteriaceae bacterium]